MNRLKLMTIVGTRPELIKLSETIKKADKYFDHIFVHTGQNYDKNLNDIFYDDLNLRRPDLYLNVVGSNLGESIGNVISKSYNALNEIKPDAVLILGDTNSALSAISAKRLKIPIFHIEAGNRCFDQNVPEEINRKIVDHISDVNLPYTEHARRNLLAEGLKAEYMFVTGSPMREVIEANKAKIDASNVLERLTLTEKQYIVLSAHREENIDKAETFESLILAINTLAEQYQVPIIYSVHPRSAKFIKERNVKFHDLVRQMPPFSFTDYIALQKNSLCVVSDSGTLAEESSICNFPAVSIRTSTERPEAVDKGGFVIGGVAAESILPSIEIAIKTHNNTDKSKVIDYSDDNFSVKIIKIIQGYANIVNLP
ncbi:UDP-N-acetylglucosamine 2-epimerase (non-hydrolyzing) [Fibrobacterales bacterium]|nr:UDP-N-acetylglucosamine 2-epimerase (non-hydrolyzing) [Fibrobacterales bacterium]